MHLWKAAASKIRAVKGMRGFRDKIKDTKTKLLRRDSKDSAEDASAVRPNKTAKGGSGNGDNAGGNQGSWGRKSKRHSLGRDPSKSEQSLVSASDRTVDTTEPDTPTCGAPAEANGDIVIEGGTAPKRRSGDVEDVQPVQPQLASPSPPAKPPVASSTPTPPLPPPPPQPPVADAGSIQGAPPIASQTAVSAPPAEQLPVVESRREVPAVLVQTASSDTKNGVLGVEGEGGHPSQNPLAENENLQPQPQSSSASNAATASPAPLPPPTSASAPELSTKAPAPGLTSHPSVSSDKAVSSDTVTTTISRTPSRKLADRTSDPLIINTTNLPPFSRPYRLAQFPTDSSGLRTDTDVSTLSQLQRSSSRTSLSTHEPVAPETVEPPERDKREPSFSHAPETLVYTGPLANPPEPVSVAPVAAEAAQTLDTVSEIGGFQPENLARNESVKSNRPTLITSSGSRSRKPVLSFSRRQSLIHSGDTGLLRSLLEQESASPIYGKEGSNIQLVAVPMPQSESQLRTRRVWVKRPGGSPTQVTVAEDDFVDTVRDLCLRKYANALGRQFDSPDLMIRILPSLKPQSARRQASGMQAHTDRLLLPDEILCQLLDDYFPNGQTSEDALVVEVPQQQRARTPRPSPGPHSMSYAYGQTVHDLQLPGEDYFTPVNIVPSMPHSQSGTVRSAHNIPANPSSLSNYIANSPPPSSPGHRGLKRPGPVRMTTGSPVGSTTSSAPGGGGGVMLIPRSGNAGTERIRSTSAEVPTSPAVQPQMVALPSSPGIIKPIPQKPASPGVMPTVTSPPAITKPPPKLKDTPSIGTLDGQVPSINVLIVEDNIINLRLLEAFMKRLKVRWATAMNGRDAVTKWRTGGFQLVLMDIQLPIMNGLDATKEIRRLERLNGIGSFSSGPANPEEEISPSDKLEKSLVFKGSVIIVALTASSLRSDRDEALAVGCNDFLTKPVNFTFLERKVMEWGCMQALIDFEGWRKWKDLANKPGGGGGKGGKATRKASAAKKAATVVKDMEPSSVLPASNSVSSSSSTPHPPQPAPDPGQS